MNGVCHLLVVGAGVSVALQQVLNARLRGELGSPWWAGVVSYLGGFVVMVAVAVASGDPRPTIESAARTSWASWTGGLFGAVFIGVAILMVPRLGAATVLTLVVLGQMLGSLAIDHYGILDVPVHPATPVRLAGVVCLVLGALLIRL